MTTTSAAITEKLLRVRTQKVQRLVFIIACAGIFAIYIYVSFFFRNDALDDQWITFHYARSLARGLGFRWNPAEQPVEGFTCFLWVIINAVGIRLHVSPLLWSQSWSLFAGGVAIAAIVSPANPLVLSRLWRLFAGLTFALCPVAVFMAQSGMETQASVTLVLLGIFSWVNAEKRKWRWLYLLSSLLLVLACMTRPENGIFLVCLTVCSWSNHRLDSERGERRVLSTSPFGLMLIPIFVVGVPYMIWRIMYFGYLLPNTYYAKYSGHGLSNLSLGVRYLGDSLGLYLAIPSIVTSTVLVLSAHHSTRLIRQIFVICTLFVIYITYAGGDDVAAFPMGRLFLPVICLCVVLAAASLEWTFSQPVAARPAVAAIVVGCLILLCEIPAWYTLGKEANPELSHSYSVRRALLEPVLRKAENPGVPTPSPLTDWILAHSSREDYIAIGGAGRIPYLSDRPTIDLEGLNDVHIAHMRTSERGINVKSDPDYVLRRKPRLVLILMDKQGCELSTGVSPDCVWETGMKQLIRLLDDDPDYHLDPAILPWSGTDGGVIRCWVRSG